MFMDPDEEEDRNFDSPPPAQRGEDEIEQQHSDGERRDDEEGEEGNVDSAGSDSFDEEQQRALEYFLQKQNEDNSEEEEEETEDKREKQHSADGEFAVNVIGDEQGEENYEDDQGFYQEQEQKVEERQVPTSVVDTIDTLALSREAIKFLNMHMPGENQEIEAVIEEANNDVGGAAAVEAPRKGVEEEEEEEEQQQYQEEDTSPAEIQIEKEAPFLKASEEESSPPPSSHVDRAAEAQYEENEEEAYHVESAAQGQYDENEAEISRPFSQIMESRKAEESEESAPKVEIVEIQQQEETSAEETNISPNDEFQEETTDEIAQPATEENSSSFLIGNETTTINNDRNGDEPSASPPHEENINSSNRAIPLFTMETTDTTSFTTLTFAEEPINHEHAEMKTSESNAEQEEERKSALSSAAAEATAAALAAASSFFQNNGEAVATPASSSDIDVTATRLVFSTISSYPSADTSRSDDTDGNSRHNRRQNSTGALPVGDSPTVDSGNNTSRGYNTSTIRRDPSLPPRIPTSRPPSLPYNIVPRYTDYKKPREKKEGEEEGEQYDDNGEEGEDNNDYDNNNNEDYEENEQEEDGVYISGPDSVIRDVNELDSRSGRRMLRRAAMEVAYAEAQEAEDGKPKPKKEIRHKEDGEEEEEEEESKEENVRPFKPRRRHRKRKRRARRERALLFSLHPPLTEPRASLRIQRAFRFYSAKKFVSSELKFIKHSKAALTIQTWARGFMVRRRKALEEEPFKSARERITSAEMRVGWIVLLGVWKLRLWPETRILAFDLEKKKRDYIAATKINALVRSWLARRFGHSFMISQDILFDIFDSAIDISRKRRSCVSHIWSQYRAHILKKNLIAFRELPETRAWIENKASTVIQCSIRRHWSVGKCLQIGAGTMFRFQPRGHLKFCWLTHCPFYSIHKAIIDGVCCYSLYNALVKEDAETLLSRLSDVCRSLEQVGTGFSNSPGAKTAVSSPSPASSSYRLKKYNSNDKEGSFPKPSPSSSTAVLSSPKTSAAAAQQEYALQIVIFCCVAAVRYSQNGDTTSAIIVLSKADDMLRLCEGRRDLNHLTAYLRDTEAMVFNARNELDLAEKSLVSALSCLGNDDSIRGVELFIMIQCHLANVLLRVYKNEQALDSARTALTCLVDIYSKSPAGARYFSKIFQAAGLSRPHSKGGNNHRKVSPEKPATTRDEGGVKIPPMPTPSVILTGTNVFPPPLQHQQQHSAPSTSRSMDRSNSFQSVYSSSAVTPPISPKSSSTAATRSPPSKSKKARATNSVRRSALANVMAYAIHVFSGASVLVRDSETDGDTHEPSQGSTEDIQLLERARYYLLESLGGGNVIPRVRNFGCWKSVREWLHDACLSCYAYYLADTRTMCSIPHLNPPEDEEGVAILPPRRLSIVGPSTALDAAAIPGGSSLVLPLQHQSLPLSQAHQHDDDHHHQVIVSGSSAKEIFPATSTSAAFSNKNSLSGGMTIAVNDHHHYAKNDFEGSISHLPSTIVEGDYDFRYDQTSNFDDDSVVLAGAQNYHGRKKRPTAPRQLAKSAYELLEQVDFSFFPTLDRQPSFSKLAGWTKDFDDDEENNNNRAAAASLLLGGNNNNSSGMNEDDDDPHSTTKDSFVRHRIRSAASEWIEPLPPAAEEEGVDYREENDRFLDTSTKFFQGRKPQISAMKAQRLVRGSTTAIEGNVGTEAAVLGIRVMQGLASRGLRQGGSEQVREYLPPTHPALLDAPTSTSSHNPLSPVAAPRDDEEPLHPDIQLFMRRSLDNPDENRRRKFLPKSKISVKQSRYENALKNLNRSISSPPATTAAATSSKKAKKSKQQQQRDTDDEDDDDAGIYNDDDFEDDDGEEGGKKTLPAGGVSSSVVLPSEWKTATHARPMSAAERLGDTKPPKPRPLSASLSLKKATKTAARTIVPRPPSAAKSGGGMPQLAPSDDQPPAGHADGCWCDFAPACALQGKLPRTFSAANITWEQARILSLSAGIGSMLSSHTITSKDFISDLQVLSSMLSSSHTVGRGWGEEEGGGTGKRSKNNNREYLASILHTKDPKKIRGARGTATSTSGGGVWELIAPSDTKKYYTNGGKDGSDGAAGAAAIGPPPSRIITDSKHPLALVTPTQWKQRQSVEATVAFQLCCELSLAGLACLHCYVEHPEKYPDCREHAHVLLRRAEWLTSRHAVSFANKPLMEWWAQINLARLCDVSQHYESASEYLDLAFELSRDSWELQAITLLNISIVSANAGAAQKAIQAACEARAIIQRILSDIPEAGGDRSMSGFSAAMKASEASVMYGKDGLLPALTALAVHCVSAAGEVYSRVVCAGALRRLQVVETEIMGDESKTQRERGMSTDVCIRCATRFTSWLPKEKLKGLVG